MDTEYPMVCSLIERLPLLPGSAISRLLRCNGGHSELAAVVQSEALARILGQAACDGSRKDSADGFSALLREFLAAPLKVPSATQAQE